MLTAVRIASRNTQKGFLGTSFSIWKSTKRNSFFEADDKDGYRKNVEISTVKSIKHGLGLLKGEVKLWAQEVKEKLEDDPILIYRPGEIDTIFQFNEVGDLDKWVLTSDSDHNEGFSNCELHINKHGKGVFQGNICTRLPKDGYTKKAGYCNMRTLRPKKSFQRTAHHDWSAYTHLILRVRGDGRPYLININTAGYFDITWNDAYHFILYTRGGPYWQYTKIPFSRFFLAAKGRIQDKQERISLDLISSYGFTAGDRKDGPFRLEIDYIGLEFDPSHQEQFAYEMYKAPKFVIGT